VARWWRVLEARAHVEASPVNPQRVFWELSPRLPEETVLTCDSGTAANWYARDVKLRRGMKASLSGGLATMGPALPYAIAAKLVHPDRPVVAMLGDGAMQMNGLNALITLARMWRDWADPRLVVMVLNNRDLNFPYARFAEMLGLAALRVDTPEAIGPAWDAAFAADRPMLLEMVTDSAVPPLPPDVSLAQAKSYLLALWQGDPEAMRTIKATMREYWASATA
jgi:pyruvate dehydrogenase (quinone)